MSLDNKLTLMFLQQLRIETQFSAISGVLAQTETRLAHLEKLCELAWTPNKSQMVCSFQHLHVLLANNTRTENFTCTRSSLSGQGTSNIHLTWRIC